MIKSGALFKNVSLKTKSVFTVFLSFVLAVISCFVLASEVSAATVSVDTFAELKSACQTSGTVKITSKIAVTDTITVPKGVTVYLTCSHAAGSTTTDIYRAQGFHGHLFKVNDGATLYVRCAIDGNNKDGNGNLRGTGATGTESSGYYGQALILNYGNVIMDNDKSVLKNNYNAYNNDYKSGVLWTYNGVKYYGLSASPESTSLAGSAVLCVNGKLTMSNGQIYGCYADNGPAIYVCNGYSGDTVKISGGTIKNNVARRYGGAIFAASRKPYSAYSDSSSFVGSRTLNSTGSNAMLTISGGNICNNLARLNSGGVWIGFGGTLYMSGGSIYNNDAIEEGGGGIRVNAGGAGTTGGWMCFANPGGQTWIAGGSIYGNTCATNGGGITVPDNDDSNNQLKITGGSIYSNTAGGNGGGVYCASKLVVGGGKIYKNTASGNGGGVYSNGADSIITMSAGEIYNNKANYGAGVYLSTSGKASTLSGGSIYSNTATTSGGGLGNARTNGATLSGTAIYSNSAKYGGGVYNAGVLNVKGSNIYSNTANDSNGGGVYVTGDSSKLSMTSGVIRNNTSVSHGGGIYFTTAGKACTISGGSIYGNKAGGSGGAFLSYRTNGITLSGGNVYSNSAEKYGGGVYIGDSLFNMTGGTIYSNTADSGKGKGMFVAGDSTVKMSKTALVKSDNDVFLNTYNYITVPTAFTGTQNVRAVLKGDNFKVGRVVAKYGANTSDAGSKALYWDSSNPNMSKQYFVLGDSGNVLRSGDQGAASNSASGVVKQDVFISDTYTISFKGNLSGCSVTVPANIYKYWYETLSNVSFANAKADTVLYAFKGWNSASNGSGKSYSSPMTYSANADLALYAQWKANTVTINYYSNYADSSSNTVINAVDGAKNVLVMQSVVTPTSNLSNGLYNYWGSSLNLGRAYYSGTGYWNTKADGTGKGVHQDTAFGGLEELVKALGAEVSNGNITVNVYAQWVPNTLTINHYSNFADSSSDTVLNAVSGDKNVMVMQSVVTPTSNLSNGLYNYWGSSLNLGKTGYTGTGYWNTKVDGTGISIHQDKGYSRYQDLAKDLGADISKANATVNVYAQWMPSLIDVDYDGNGATKGEDWTETVDFKDSKEYLLSDNDSAFERTEVFDDTRAARLFKFVGWTLGDVTYEFGAAVPADILSSASKSVSGRKNKVATVYATWDEYPTINAVDRWFTLDEAQSGAITFDNLKDSAQAIDGEIGDKTLFNDEDGEGVFTIIDFDEEEFKRFDTSGSVTVTYQAIDKVGNETYRTITVHIVDKDRQVDDIITRFTRFISAKYFKDSKGNPVPEGKGGLSEKSIWLNDVGYNECLTKALENTLKDDGSWSNGVVMTFVFTQEDIVKAKAYIETHGPGNLSEPNALKGFYQEFPPVS